MQLLNNPAYGQGRPGNPNYYSVVQPSGQDIDTVSQASSAYVGKSKLHQGRAKSAAHSVRSQMKQQATVNSQGMKVYIPTEYFKHAGYSQKKEGATEKPGMRPASAASKQKPFVAERFNE